MGPACSPLQLNLAYIEAYVCAHKQVKCKRYFLLWAPKVYKASILKEPIRGNSCCLQFLFMDGAKFSARLRDAEECVCEGKN